MRFIDKSRITVEQRIDTIERNEFENSLNLEINNMEDINELLQDGNMLFSVGNGSQALADLLENGWNITNKTQQEVITGKRKYLQNESVEYLKLVTQNIFKVDYEMPLRTALQEIFNIREALGRNFAGALLVRGSEILNPLHPLIALGIVDNVNWNTDDMKLVIYTYDNRRDEFEAMLNDNAESDEELAELDEDEVVAEPEAIVSKERIEANVANLVRLFTVKEDNTLIKTRLVDILHNEEGRSDRYTQVYQRSVHKNMIGVSSEFVVVPMQLLTNGIVAPYYGTAVIGRNHGQDPKGISLSSAFMGVNLGKTLEIESGKIKLTNICTGSLPKQSLEGIRGIGHCNLSSPLNRETIGVGALDYADACIAKSLALYELGGLINVKSIEQTAGFDGTEEDANRREREDAESEWFDSDEHRAEEALLERDEEITAFFEPTEAERQAAISEFAAENGFNTTPAIPAPIEEI